MMEINEFGGAIMDFESTYLTEDDVINILPLTGNVGLKYQF